MIASRPLRKGNAMWATCEQDLAPLLFIGGISYVCGLLTFVVLFLGAAKDEGERRRKSLSAR